MNEGIYDQLITQKLRRSIANIDSARLRVVQSALEEADSPHYLSRHLAKQIKTALASLPKEEQRHRQIELANALLKVAGDDNPEFLEESIPDPAEILKAIHKPPTAPDLPQFPLATSSLIMNVAGESRLGTELQRELRTADSVLMLVSFIQWRGWLRLKSAFQSLASSGKSIRVLTTTYIGASDLRALKEMVELPNVELKISLDGRRRRLHAKAWLFERLNGFSTAYVGSANVSGPALEDGIEWTVKLSEVETPHIVEKFRGAFESLWEDDEFQRFSAGDSEFEERIRLALQSASGRPGIVSVPEQFFDLKPFPYQQATLDQLAAERLDRNHWRNLVVAPTGTGKTMLAAFDYKRQPAPGGVLPRLLFLAHREELLIQARRTFRQVLRDESFGDLLVGGEQPSSYNHLFATIQSFQSRELWTTCAPDHWHFVVLDEAHHVTAESYREAVEVLQPKILLGLTATPERMDGQSILPWFDNRIADEMRLWHAIERQFLTPFDYYGIHDGTDLTSLGWSRGGYVASQLSKLYNADQHRAKLIVKHFTATYGDYRNAKALGFCVSIEHADFMATIFNRCDGIRAQAVTSATPDSERKSAIRRLQSGELNVLFTVDLFNEGVDIPELDCLLFLRPTESSTVFLQQLGRGLRLSSGKMNCLVLDFIGNQRAEFRFDARLSALFGGTRRQTIEQLESGITALPGNCYFTLDKESQKLILANLKTQLRYSHGLVIGELSRIATKLGRCPSLLEFLSESHYELPDIYRDPSSWSSLKAELGLLQGSLTPDEAQLAARFRTILHLDSVFLIASYRNFLLQTEDHPQNRSILENRRALMMTYRLLQTKAEQASSEWQVFEQIRQSATLRHDFFELTNCLLDRIHTHVEEAPYSENIPIVLHRSYQRDEIMVAFGEHRLGKRKHHREGILRIPSLNTELFLVTLDKSAKSFSPTTRYEDYAISPTRFHWQSQSTTSAESRSGLNYQEQESNGATFLLFVRPNSSEPYTFLGPLTYLSHRGSRPMSIEWNLDHPMPAWFFEICASLRAA